MFPEDISEFDLVHKIAGISCLKKGDRVKFVRAHGHSGPEVLYATVDMDGHRVSEDYGSLAGNRYYEEHPNKDYINVKLDAIKYVTAIHQNSTIYARDGWDVFGTLATQRRVQNFLNGQQNKNRRIRLQENLTKAQDLLAEVQRTISAINAELDALS